MQLDLKETFDKHFAHVKFDPKLAKQFYHLQVGFVNKNQDHMDFFGGVLTGVQRVRFTSLEINQILETILRLDVQKLKRDFEHSEGIVASRKIAGDLLNFVFVYTAHRFYTSELLSKENREKAVVDIIILSSMRSLAALMVRDFQTLVDPRLAERVYARMSNRFILKKLGSWQRYLVYRGNSVLDEDYPHKKTMVNFDPPQAVVDWAVDVHNRVKETLKDIYGIIMETHGEGDKLKAGSLSGIDMEGNEVVVDKTTGLQTRIDYVLQVLPDANTFSKHELIKLVSKANPTTGETYLERTLHWLSEFYFTDDHKLIEKIVVDSLTLCYSYLEDENYIRSHAKDLGFLLVKLKNMIMSSRSSNETLIALREIGLVPVEASAETSNPQLMASIRTSMILYIFIRAYTKDFFVKQ